MTLYPYVNMTMAATFSIALAAHGALVEVTGSYRTSFLITAVLNAGILVLLILTNRRIDGNTQRGSR